MKHGTRSFGSIHQNDQKCAGDRIVMQNVSVPVFSRKNIETCCASFENGPYYSGNENIANYTVLYCSATWPEYAKSKKKIVFLRAVSQYPDTRNWHDIVMPWGGKARERCRNETVLTAKFLLGVQCYNSPQIPISMRKSIRLQIWRQICPNCLQSRVTDPICQCVNQFGRLTRDSGSTRTARVRYSICLQKSYRRQTVICDISHVSLSPEIV